MPNVHRVQHIFYLGHSVHHGLNVQSYSSGACIGVQETRRWERFVCGLAAGTIAKLGTHPLDVCKKRFQARSYHVHPDTALSAFVYIYIYIAVDLSHLNRGLTLKPCAGCGVAAFAQVWSARASRVSEVTAGLPATHLAAGRSQRSLQGQPAQYSEGSALCSYHFHRIRVYSWCPDSTCRNGVG